MTIDSLPSINAKIDMFNEATTHSDQYSAMMVCVRKKKAILNGILMAYPLVKDLIKEDIDCFNTIVSSKDHERMSVAAAKQAISFKLNPIPNN